MTSFSSIMDYLHEVNLVSMLVRFAIALLGGGIIGMSRGKRQHAAGLRTHLLVCIGAASVMMTSLYQAQNLGVPGDAFRMPAQVVSGVGFLGAGSILVTGKRHVTGLTTTAGLWASACMGLAAGERVISMRRLRLADDVPMLIEHTYLPGKIFSGLTSDEVDSRSLYKIMAQDYHVEVRVAEEEFYASVARREDARLLGISEGAPVLQLFRLTYNTRNQVVEFTKGVARADQFHYKVSYYGGSSA